MSGEASASARRWLSLWLATMVALSTATTGALSWLLLDYAARPGPGAPADHILDPPAQLGVEGLATRLATLGVIAHPEAFVALLRLLDAAPHLRKTHTVVRPQEPLNQALSRLMHGRGQAVLRLTFPEGFDRFDIAGRLAKFGVSKREAFLDVSTRPADFARFGLKGPSLEGYLFPDTYDFAVSSWPGAAAQRFVQTFQRRVGPLFEAEQAALKRLQEELGFDTHDVVTLASVVEKEARLPRERPTIAGVFLNRLRDPGFRPHRLQADPTVAYGCRVAPAQAPSCAGFDGRRVTPAMVRDPLNPYNTYRHDGLPPGPICNPGLDAIRAVLHAQSHGYYYFVARGDGSHTFSATLEEHNRAIHGERDGR